LVQTLTGKHQLAYVLVSLFNINSGELKLKTIVLMAVVAVTGIAAGWILGSGPVACDSDKVFQASLRNSESLALDFANMQQVGRSMHTITVSEHKLENYEGLGFKILIDDVEYLSACTSTCSCEVSASDNLTNEN